MEKQNPAYNNFPELGRFILDAQKGLGRQSKKTKITPFESTIIKLLIRKKTRLSLIIPHLLICFRPKSP